MADTRRAQNLDRRGVEPRETVLARHSCTPVRSPNLPSLGVEPSRRRYKGRMRPSHFAGQVERGTGIEPVFPVWKTGTLPIGQPLEMVPAARLERAPTALPMRGSPT